MEEIWKEIPDYEGIYWINNYGEVKNNFDKILIPTIKYNGYQSIILTKNGISKTKQIHRLVMLAFQGPPPDESFQVNHIDEDPSNNCIDNLEYISPQDNCNYENRLIRIQQTKLENENKKIFCSKDVEGKEIIKIYSKPKLVIKDGYNYDIVLRASLGKYNQGTHKYKGVYWFRKEF